MNSLYNLALRQSSSIQSDLARLDAELAASASASTSSALQGQVAASLAALSRTVDDYENLAKRELNATKREKALQRVKKFRDDEREHASQLRRVKARAFGPIAAAGSSSLSTSAALSQDSALHARSPSAHHTSNDAAGASSSSFGSTAIPIGSAGANGYGFDRPDPLSAYRMNASAEAMFGAGSSSSAREQMALREHSFIGNAESQLDGFIAQGREIWDNIREQRDILKGTQRRLRDVALTLGLSRDVIGYIERRSTQDNLILGAGAIFTLVCFYYIYKWFG